MTNPNHLFPKRGRPGLLLSMEIEKELTPLDIAELVTVVPLKVSAPPLKTIKARHRQAALMVAKGYKNTEVAMVCGYTAQRVSDLQSDPMFVSLVTYYQKQRTDLQIEDEARLNIKILHGAEAAWDEILERLEDENQIKRLPVSELRQIAQLGFDRTVAPPKSAVTTTTAPVEITFNIAGKGIRNPAEGGDVTANRTDVNNNIIDVTDVTVISEGVPATGTNDEIISDESS